MAELDGLLIAQKYGLTISKGCEPRLVSLMDLALEDLVKLFAGHAPDWMQVLEIRFEPLKFGGLTSQGLIRLSPKNLTSWTIVHEFAHAWDFASGMKLSRKLGRTTRSWNTPFGLQKMFPEEIRFWYHIGSPPPPCGTDSHFNAREDFAESLTAYVYPDEASRRAEKRGLPYKLYGYEHFHDTPRGKFIRNLLTREK